MEHHDSVRLSGVRARGASREGTGVSDLDEWRSAVDSLSEVEREENCGHSEGLPCRYCGAHEDGEGYAVY